MRLKKNMSNSPEQISNFKSVFAHFVGYDGAGKAHTLTSLSLVTGISKVTVRSHLVAGGSEPGLAMLMLYFRELDTSFTDAILSPAGLSVIRSMDHKAPTSQQAVTELSRTVTELSVALENNDVDDIEKRSLSPVLRQTGQDMLALANSYDDHLKESA
ncbi:MAG: hypothetical protein JKY45_13080 [Emcibacter sp.]|nr:hypothetical protein [Emcibacter sp.]